MSDVLPTCSNFTLAGCELSCCSNWSMLSRSALWIGPHAFFANSSTCEHTPIYEARPRDSIRETGRGLAQRVRQCNRWAEWAHLSSARRREHAAEVHEWALLERWQQRVGERSRRGALLGARRVHKQATWLRLHCLHPTSIGKWRGLETKEQ